MSSAGPLRVVRVSSDWPSASLAKSQSRRAPVVICARQSRDGLSCYVSDMVSRQLRIGRGAWSITAFRARAIASCRIALITLLGGAAIACDVNGALARLSEANRLAADVLVQFTKAADAANRAVMADTDEASVAFAREARQATEAAQRDTDALRPILQSLSYSNETRLLDEFAGRFAEYRALDGRVLNLAVENTNLKAQRLAFGPAQEAANAFRDSLRTVAASARANEQWRIEALVEKAVATVREIQVLQAPHIADADEAVMTRMEREMATSELAARDAIKMLTPLVQPGSRPRLAAASASLDQFMDLNGQIIALSRRNTNVRSLALSLDQKRKLITACEDSLHALRDALAKRGYTGRR
jgi:hypothetical protein